MTVYLNKVKTVEKRIAKCKKCFFYKRPYKKNPMLTRGPCGNYIEICEDWYYEKIEVQYDSLSKKSKK